MTFFLIFNYFGNNWKKNHQKEKANLIINAIKNNFILKVIEIIKYLWIYESNMLILLIILMWEREAWREDHRVEYT